MNSLILLTGIPGTGKTTIADYLKDNYGFEHVNIETLWNNHTFPQDFVQFQNYIDSIPKEKTVITWGFPTWLVKNVEYIVQQGFKHVWLEGDRNVSFKYFMEREKNNPEMEKAYHIQVSAIDKDRVVEILNPTIYNPYTKEGKFKEEKIRAEEILNL